MLSSSAIRLRRWRRQKIDARTDRLPGMQAIVLSLYLFGFENCRYALYHWGIPLSLRLTSEIGSSIAFLLFMHGTAVYLKRYPPRVTSSASQYTRVVLWLYLIGGLAFYGLARGNPLNSVGHEAIVLSIMGVTLFLGTDDRAWYAVDKHLTILFWLGVVLLITPNLYVALPEVKGAEFVDVSDRFSGTIASLLGPLTASGLFLGVWGLVSNRCGIWKVLQVLAPVASVGIYAGVFLFRSAAAYFLITLVSCLVLRPLLERKVRLVASVLIILAIVPAVAFYSLTESADRLMQRVNGEISGENGLFGERVAEVKACVSDLGWETVIGRGLGGTFDASGIYIYESAKQWGTMHFGVLVFGLKGGILLMWTFIGFVVPGMRIRKRVWYQNPCNMTATLLSPVSFLGIATGPFSLIPEAAIAYLPLMLMLARFGRKEQPESGKVMVGKRQTSLKVRPTNSCDPGEEAISVRAS